MFLIFNRKAVLEPNEDSKRRNDSGKGILFENNTKNPSDDSVGVFSRVGVPPADLIAPAPEKTVDIAVSQPVVRFNFKSLEPSNAAPGGWSRTFAGLFSFMPWF